MRKNFWYFILFSIVFISCNKEKDPEYIYLNSYTKDHFYFKKGSYWIYKDSVSGRVDSFYLMNSSINVVSSESANTIGEVLKLEIVQANSDIRWIYTLTNNSMTLSYQENDKEIWVSRGNIFSAHDAFVSYPPGHTRFYSGKTGDLKVENIIFSNIWTVLFEDSLATSKSTAYQIQHFYNDSVGFIKTNVDYNSSTNSIHEIWELQRWNTIK